MAINKKSQSFVVFFAVPALYLLLVVFTMYVSSQVPGGAYYRIFGVAPLAAVIGMVHEGANFYVALLLFGTAWWVLVAYCGWKSKESGMVAAASALMSLVSVVMAAVMTKSPFYQDMREGLLSVSAVFQYVGVGVLCLGALTIAIYSTWIAFGRNKPTQSPG
jgi:hypothetical protein